MECLVKWPNASSNMLIRPMPAVLDGFKEWQTFEAGAADPSPSIPAI
jgi:hypothetical protein